MGPSTARGRHAASRAGLPQVRPLPADGDGPAPAVGRRARHARPSQVPTGTLVLTVAAGGLLTVAVPAAAQSIATSAAASAVLPRSGPTPPAADAAPADDAAPPGDAAPSGDTAPSGDIAPSDAAPSDARQALDDRASRSRRALPVVTTPPTSPPVSTPAPVLLPSCSQPAVVGGANGRLDPVVLCDVGSDERLRADAARAYAAFAVAYQSRFGTAPCLIDGYRTLGEQQQLRRTKPRFAARPGSSEHGWGLAIDLGCGVQSRRTVQHAWLQANGSAYGWVNPDWARSGGSRPEPWHWEFASTGESAAPRP